MNAANFADKLGAKKNARGWLAKCPAHADNTASLSISEGSDGKVLLKCFAGCDFAAIVTAANVEPQALFPGDSEPKAASKPVFDCAYDYRDESGELLYQAVRLKNPKTFRQRRPFENGWRWSLPASVRKVLYGTEKLSKAPQGSTVYLVEGEKDADRLNKGGLLATTNIGGASSDADSKWQDGYTQQLRGHRVAIIQDNDEPGKRHAQSVSRKLTSAKIKNVIVELPGLDEHGDFSDWAAAGGTKREFIEICNDALLADAAKGFSSSSDRLVDANEIRKRNISRVLDYNISYLDDELLGIHPNDIVIIMAATGAGKTTLGSILASNAAKSGSRVAFFALEAYQNEIEIRDLYRAIITMAKEAGDYRGWMTQQMWVKKGIKELDKFVQPCIEHLQKKLKSMFTFYRTASFGQEDVEREFIALKGKVDLIVLDHIHYIDTDGNENQALKNITKAIRDCGQRLDIPVIVIAHIRKRGTNANNKQMMPVSDDLHGSSDIAKMATVIISVAPARDEEFRATEPDIANTFMSVVKDRIGGDKGFAALMQFSLTEMNYKTKYRICRRMPDGSAQIAEKVPNWAHSAVRGVQHEFQGI